MQQPVYITRPERIIWPVILLVALTLFNGAAEATFSRLSLPQWGARSAPEAPRGEFKEPAHERLVARQAQRAVAVDLRIAIRRASVVVRLRTTFVAGHVLEVKSHRQLVVSPRPGGLVRYFPTAPPARAIGFG